MNRLTLDLPADCSIALRRLAVEFETDHETAAIVLLRDALIAGGWLEQHEEIDEDGGTGRRGRISMRSASLLRVTKP